MAKRGTHRWLWGLPCVAGAFLAYSLHLYGQAGVTPMPPVTQRQPDYRPPGITRSLPGADRYAALAGGRIFFGEAAVPATGPLPPLPYISALTLRGIVLRQGQPPVAVLARAGAPPEGESYVVKTGETVLGETVTAIDATSVVLNKNGQESVLVLP